MFSVIIPVYNGEKFIDNAINSILRQKINDWELIIVNDGSKDNTADVLEKYKTNEKITIIKFELREPSLHEIFVEKVGDSNEE